MVKEPPKKLRWDRLLLALHGLLQLQGHHLGVLAHGVELALQERLDWDTQVLGVTDPSPTGNPVLDRVLKTLAEARDLEGVEGAEMLERALVELGAVDA